MNSQTPFRITGETRRRPAAKAFQPRYEVTDAMRADLLAIESAERALLGRDVDPNTRRRLTREALARNTYGTVSIEGNPLSLGQVTSLLEAAPTAVNALQPAERDVINIASFLAELDQHETPRTIADVEHLHGLLFAGTVPGPGTLKKTPNFIGRHSDRTVVFIPASPEDTPEDLDRALTWFHASTEHPVIRVAVFFHEFQSIHPFVDGNGRLGRAIAALQLHHLGYRGVSLATVDFAINQDRGAYYAAIAEAQGGSWDLTTWIGYWVRVLRTAFDDAVQRCVLGEAVPNDLDRIALEIAVWVARRDRVRPGRQVATNDVHAAFPAIPRRTLQRHLARLVAAGVLELEGRGRGARYRLHESRRQP